LALRIKLVKIEVKRYRFSFYTYDEKDKLRSRLADYNLRLIVGLINREKFSTFKKARISRAV
jgi:hypothetical protein